MNLDSVWRNFEQFDKTETEPPVVHRDICRACLQATVQQGNSEAVCYNCGHVVPESTVLQVAFETAPEMRKSTRSNTKVHNWMLWSNEEKNTYKLNQYTKSICKRLEIHDSLITSICETVVNVMTVIKKFEGTKRARVKDGIILVCAEYVAMCSQSQTQKVTAVELAKKMGLETKYITKADKMILELKMSNKLDMKRQSVSDIPNPYKYVEDVVTKHNLKIPRNILQQVRKLIQVCEDQDLLLDNTPLSVGVSCFYYCLKKNNIGLDLKMFSDIYDLSIVTVTKTYNKLKGHHHILEKYEL